MYGTACLPLGRAAHVHRRLYKHARLVTPDMLMSLHNGTGNNHFAGVTCTSALHTQLAVAALLPHAAARTLCCCCACTYCSLAPSHAGTAYDGPTAACPGLLLAILPWDYTGNTANQLNKYSKNELLHAMTVPPRQCSLSFDQEIYIWLNDS